MKDITDYFVSPPTKGRKSAESLKMVKSVDESSSSNQNSIAKNTKDDNLNETKRIKKKRRRKPTDPEVKNMTELLSNNLSFISPNKSGSGSPLKNKADDNTNNEEKSIKKNNQPIKNPESKSLRKSNPKIDNVENMSMKNVNDDHLIEIVDTESNSETPKEVPKVNAFQFMMNSRNNVIGQNSSGKTSKELDDNINEDKSKLATRKNLFKNWADNRGALKRKREEEEIEKCIDIKMEKRARRLKKMLKGKSKNDVGKEVKKISPLKKSKTIKLLSSSESENENATTSTALIIEENAQDIILSVSSPPPKKLKENNQNNLHTFFGVGEKIAKEERIEVFEESRKDLSKEFIKIKMFTPESTKKRTSLFSLNRERTKSVTDESSQESVKVGKHKKRKKKGNDSGENVEHDSLEDFCSPEGKKGGKKKSKKRGKDSMAKKSNKDDAKKDILILDDEKDTHLTPENAAEVINQSNFDLKDESTEDSDIFIPKKIRNTKHIVILDESEDSKSSVIEISKPKSNKKGSKNKDHQNKSDPIQTEDEEPRGRVLRPKRNNLNYSDLFKDQTPKSPKVKKEKSSAKKTKKSFDESVEKISLSSDSEYEEKPKKSKTKNPVKVAPVFLKATPKPKLDPQVAEARKQFLMSGVPESLKITVEKQKSIEEKEYDIFPSISHIQQKCQSGFWELPKANLKMNKFSPFKLNKDLKCMNLVMRTTPYEVNISTETRKITQTKNILDLIKNQNPNYPVYKVFRHLNEKCGRNPKENKSPGKQSRRSTRKSTEKVQPAVNTELIVKDYEMWSEKYKPRSSEEILGNHKGVTSLRNWLETWMKYSEEINSRRKPKQSNSNSESEFESTDCDSRDSTRLPGNTMILGGPCGSGKTSAVYAIAHELGFNVLELNASSKRTGKKLLQELQEATQSHQVRKNKHNSLTNFVEADKTKKNKKTAEPDGEAEQKDKKKMCILLVEDIDLVFDQDEGFLASLYQLITTSKRPIILTTTDSSPPHIQKLLGIYESISFMPLSLQCLSVWLQILCLVEGFLVDKDDLGNLLEYNKGDIRKTLLEVQFWSLSGGQLEKSRVFPLKVRESSNFDLKGADESLKVALTDVDSTKENPLIHRHCLASFEVFRGNKQYSIPQYLSLELLWWNIPNILNVSSDTSERIQRQKGHIESSQKNKSTSLENSGQTDMDKLNSMMCLYDSLILSDSLLRTINCHTSNEPIVKNWMTEVRDSLELVERKEDREMYSDVVHDMSHTLVNDCIESYRGIDGENCFGLNMALPDTNERRWRAKQHICEDFLKEPIPLSNNLDRTSIAVDYLPILRDIARWEDKRAAANTKRGNRFRHYMKNLNMTFSESSCKLACSVLNLTDND